MRKLWMSCMIMLVAYAMAGCGSNENESTDSTVGDVDTSELEIETTEGEDSEIEGYYITLDDVVIAIGSTVPETVECIAEEADYFEAASCAYEGTDYIYTYNNCTVTFYDEGEDVTVGSISLTSDLVETGEGAYIGQSREDILAIYGDDYEGDDTAITYLKDNSELQFIFSDGIVISILIQAI